MNPLLKKEIRLVLPAWGLTLLLAVVPTFLLREYGDPKNVVNNFIPVWLGVLLLCAASFGREFSLGTFSGLLVLPVSRKQFWLTKVGVLVVSLVSVLMVYIIFACPWVLTEIGWFEIAWAGLLLLAAVAGGLWLALIIRQMAAVVWLIALVPGILCIPLLTVLTHFNAADKTTEIIIYALLLVYSVAGIAASWLIFQRAQDAGWSGGIITLPAWLSTRVREHAGPDERLHVPWRALIRKEFQFNQILLLGMCGFFAFDLAEVGIRFLRRNSPGDLNSLLEGFGLIPWLLFPLIIGCTSIAEERKQGMMESQLCQPVSARRQYLVKLVFVVFFGGLLTTVFPWLAETLGQAIGVARQDMPGGAGLAAIAAGITLLALISFHASSLGRNVLQALPLAIGMVVGFSAVVSLLMQISGFGDHYLASGILLWHPVLADIILTLTFAVTLPWLTYRNFQRLPESARLWRRNGFGLLGALAFTMGASAAIYHRAWEKLTPFEPPHGTPIWTMEQRPVVVWTGLYNNLLVGMPDGRFWLGCVASDYHEPTFGNIVRNTLSLLPPPRLSLHQYLPGSNWVSLTAGFVDTWFQPYRESVRRHFVDSRDIVGIRPDGSLWVSEKPGHASGNTNPMVQFGTETDWQEVAGERSLTSVLLLKKDGTLWRWGSRTNFWDLIPPDWPGLRAGIPQQIGTNSDWQALVRCSDYNVPLAQKKDGSIWTIQKDWDRKSEEVMLNTNLAIAGFGRQRLEEVKISEGYPNAGIHPDGTLWAWGNTLHWNRPAKAGIETIEVSPETNWVAVISDWDRMVALRNDGSLWCWRGRSHLQWADIFARPPARLSGHSDWLALMPTWYGEVSLAADGSLWLWQKPGYSQENDEIMLIKPPDKPIPLGNIFAAN